MGHQDHRHAGFLLQLLHQAQHLRLGGHVKRGCRLIGDQQVRLGDHGHGDHRALAHAAREFKRIGAPSALRVGKADALETLQHLALGVGFGGGAMQVDHLDHLIADPVKWRQRTHRFLKDHRDAVATHVAAHLPFADTRQIKIAVPAAQDHAARVQACGARQNAQHGATADGLARAALADKRQRFAGVHREIHIPDNRRVLPEPNTEIFNRQKGTHSGAPVMLPLRRTCDECSP